jgi:hypothetical protein
VALVRPNMYICVCNREDTMDGMDGTYALPVIPSDVYAHIWRHSYSTVNGTYVGHGVKRIYDKAPVDTPRL